MTGIDPTATSIASLQRQQKLVDLYLFVLDRCLCNGRQQWWQQAVNLPFADVAHGLERLKDLCLHELLYGAGDIAAFCRAYEILEQEGYLDGDDDGRYLLDLMRFVQLLAEDRPRNAARGYLAWLKRRRAVVSVIIPDSGSLANFREFCLPSLEAKAGLRRLLRRRDVTLLLHVHQQGVAEVEAYLTQRRLGWTIVCKAIPDRLCDPTRIIAADLKRDWLVGSLQHLHLMAAKHLDADFHAINPNAIYASGYLESLIGLARKHPAILSALAWADNRGLLDRKLARHPDGSIEVSPIDLSSLGLVSWAAAECSTFMEGFVSPRGETAHLRVTWQDKDRIEVHSTNHEIVFLDRAAVRAMPARFFVRPSAEIDRILGPETVPHVVTEHDGIAMAELGHPPGAINAVEGDSSRFEPVVSRLARPGQVELFKRPVRLATSPMKGQQAGALRSAFLASLESAGTAVAPSAEQALSALHVLHQYEISDYGLENMAGAIIEGRRLIDGCPAGERDLEAEARKALIRAAMNFDNVDQAVALARQGGESTSFIHEFLARMMDLKATNEARAQAIRQGYAPGQPVAVIGSIAWGEAFVGKFMDYHVASLLAADNLPALARGKKVIHSIVTTEADRKRMTGHPLFERLSEHAEVVFTCFPEEFLEQRERNHYNFYYFYGLLDHQSVFLASALRAELYLLPVDIVLSRDSLANLSRRLDQGSDACAVAGIECDPVQLKAWLDAHHRGPAGELDLSVDELLTEAIARPDTYFRSLVMTPDNQAFCRYPRELIWPMPDGLAIHSIFMHPLAVSARLMSRPFHPQYENVDFALLPRLLQGDGRLEVLQDAREMVLAQFGAPAAREEFLDGGFSLEAFLEAHRYDYAAQRRWFGTRQFFPCKDPPYTPAATYPADVPQVEAALRRFRFRLDDPPDV